MKIKITCILVMMLLIITILPLVQSEENNYNHYYDDKCKSCLHMKNKIFKEIYETEKKEDEYGKPLVNNDLPDYFNWMDYNGQDWTTTGRHQGNCGSCWIFAALATLESIINIREGNADLDIDLSEQYVLSCLPRSAYVDYRGCWGGHPNSVYAYVKKNSSTGNNCNGIIPESYFPYQGVDPDGCDYFSCDHEPVLCDEIGENWEDFLIPIEDYGSWWPDGSEEDRQAMKTQIMEHGPIASYMNYTYHINGPNNYYDWGFEHNDPSDYYPYVYGNDEINHCVSIFGWKDDPSIEHGGYWICKSFDGIDWGYGGFFNIEYGSLEIDSYKVCWVEYNSSCFVNWRPKVDTGGPYSVSAGQEITFDASDCFDHEGEIVDFIWDFGDGSQEHGEIVTHSYSEPGKYLVELGIEDNDGNIVSDETWAFVEYENLPPEKPSINGPTNGANETLIEYRISAVDPNEDDLYYLIVWGDMYYDYWIGPYESGEEIVINHSWLERSEYIMRVKARDICGAKSDWETLKINIPRSKYTNNHLSYDVFYRLLNLFPILKMMFIRFIQ